MKWLLESRDNEGGLLNLMGLPLNKGFDNDVAPAGYHFEMLSSASGARRILVKNAGEA
jgi:hypothetical protein